MKKKTIITIPAKKERRHFAPPTKVIPDKKKKGNKDACRKKED